MAAEGMAEDRAVFASALQDQLNRSAAEIARRSVSQQTIEGACISADVAIAGLVVSGTVDVLLLLLLAPVNALFCSQWLDHHRTILHLGRYSATRAEPQLREEIGTATFRFWEEHLREHGAGRVPDRVERRRWQWPLWSLFVLGPALATVFLVDSAVIRPQELAPSALASSWTIHVWPRVLWVADAACLYGAAVILRAEFRTTPDPAEQAAEDERCCD